jgi:hypothetical protein
MIDQIAQPAMKARTIASRMREGRISSNYLDLCWQSARRKVGTGVEGKGNPPAF